MSALKIWWQWKIFIWLLINQCIASVCLVHLYMKLIQNVQINVILRCCQQFWANFMIWLIRIFNINILCFDHLISNWNFWCIDLLYNDIIRIGHVKKKKFHWESKRSLNPRAFKDLYISRMKEEKAKFLNGNCLKTQNVAN